MDQVSYDLVKYDDMILPLQGSGASSVVMRSDWGIIAAR
jgi:hypothetical protein